MTNANAPNLPQSNLLPLSEIARAFLTFFCHAWDFLESAIDPESWRTERRYWLEPRNFWKYYLDVDTYLGVRFGKNTRYGMADVDRNSPYHPDNDYHAFRHLLGAFEDIGLCEDITIQSSHSGGIHVYFFFKESHNTYDVACALRKAVTQAGFKVAPGILELFPNTKPYGDKKITMYNGHRLPLQHGSFLLDDDLAPYSQSVRVFIEQANRAAEGQDSELFKETLETAREWWSEYKNNRKKNRRETKSVARWKRDVEDLIKEGWTGTGQTNEMLKEIGKHGRVFLGLSGEALILYMVNTAMNSPGYAQYCRHQHEIWSRCKNWARIIEPYWLPLFNFPERRENYKQMMAAGRMMAGSITNAMRHEDARGRIQKAVAHILETVGNLPRNVKDCISLIKATTKELFNIIVNERTLRRLENLELWHPKYRITETLQENDRETAETTILQPEAMPDNNPENRPLHVDVVRKIEESQNQPEDNNNGHHSVSHPTSPLMKGKDDAPEAVSSFISFVPELETVATRTETNGKTGLKPFTNGHSEQLETGSLMNLLETLKQAPEVFFTGFKGQGFCSTVKIKNFSTRRVEAIEHNSEVELLCNSDPDYLHSHHPKMIYIKPKTGADDWLGGIAVPINLLTLSNPEYPNDS